MPDLPGALDGLGVVYFGNDWNAENRTSSHHIATRLARRMPVLYVDSPGMRAPTASGRDLRKAWRKLTAMLRKPEPIREGFWRCTVPQLPFRRIPGVDAFNRLFGRWAVRRAMRIIGMRRRISWFVVPHPGVDADLIGQRDDALSRAADVQFVAPPSLVERKQAINANTHYSPHGVDVDLFRTANEDATEVPAQARDLHAPVIGYIGSIHDWIDLDLIEWLARQRPQWTFLMVGHAAADVSALRALPNVRLVGAQPYPSLPQWAKAFDAAIIPYRLNRQVANANPLKLREYLATGKPIVSVHNPEIEKFSRWVNIAHGRDEFLHALERAIAEDTPQAAAERIAVVADQTWDRRVEQVLDTVAHSMPRPASLS